MKHRINYDCFYGGALLGDKVQQKNINLDIKKQPNIQSLELHQFMSAVCAGTFLGGLPLVP